MQTPIRTFHNTTYASSRVQNSATTDLVKIQKLIWVYFFLLIFEGALRKWILPWLATPLLLVRDPVVIAIYVLAWRSKLMPRSLFLSSLGVIALLSFVAGAFVPTGSLPTALYGVRSNFLHLPLILVMGRVLTAEDIKKMAKWTLIFAIPLAILMVLQFLAPPSSIINSGVSGDFKQLTGVSADRIRPPSTFSFVSGPSYYFAFVSAILLNMQFIRSKERPPLFLILTASFMLLIAMSVSLSRTLIAGIGLVVGIAFIATLFLQPRFLARWLWLFGMGSCLMYAMSGLPVAQEGTRLLMERTEGASGEGPTGGDMATRTVLQFTTPYQTFFETPFWGYGLGLGTLGGMALFESKGEITYVYPEMEWARNISESGPVLGTMFIVWRIILTLWLVKLSISSALRGNLLPILLFAIAGNLLLTGMLGQPTTLGFTVFIAGLCLASATKQSNLAKNSSHTLRQPQGTPLTRDLNYLK